MGYGKEQISELAQTIAKADCELVISATPINLARLIKSNKKMLRVSYDLEEVGSPDLQQILKDFQ